MKRNFFAALDVYRDVTPRSAAMNMAIDEALLEVAGAPSIRFYRWDHPALSFGYFGKVADVAAHSDRDCVRRWTGGGIVLHGEDLTYSLLVPANDPAFTESSMSTYEKVHRAVCDGLRMSGQAAELAFAGRDGALRRPRTAQRAVPTDACFANPVRWDVMMNGEKIAGAAQRRTRRGLLQQGSIQNVDLTKDFETQFAQALSQQLIPKQFDAALLDRAQKIADVKYATDAWLHRR